MMVRFEENEYFLMAMFQKESRQATMEEIHNVIPYIEAGMKKCLHLLTAHWKSCGSLRMKHF